MEKSELKYRGDTYENQDFKNAGRIIFQTCTLNNCIVSFSGKVIFINCNVSECLFLNVGELDGSNSFFFDCIFHSVEKLYVDNVSMTLSTEDFSKLLIDYGEMGQYTPDPGLIKGKPKRIPLEKKRRPAIKGTAKRIIKSKPTIKGAPKRLSRKEDPSGVGCQVCGNQGEYLFSCSRCLATRYCSKQCQHIDWYKNGHETVCFSKRSQ